MPTPKQAYQAKLNRITQAYLEMEEATVKRAIQLLRDLRKQIAGEVNAVSDFNTLQIRELRRALERLISEFESQLTGAMGQAVPAAYNNGGQAVIEPLNALNLEQLFFRPSQAQVVTLVDFSADLIKGISADLLAKINQQLRLGGLGNQTPFEVMREITRIMGLEQRTIVKGVAYRAERITRTELQRVFNLANHNQNLVALETIPGLMKRWLASGDGRTRPSHLSAHRRYKSHPIPVDQPFIVGGEKLMYPLDPNGSAQNTINCRCRSQSIHPEVGVIGGPLDALIEKEYQRRNLEAKGYLLGV